jgi:hypothetical protein
MKRLRLLLPCLLLGATLLLPACTTNDDTDANGMTAAESAAAGPPPSPNAKWRKGHYAQRGLNTVYIPGEWVQ